MSFGAVAEGVSEIFLNRHSHLTCLFLGEFLHSIHPFRTSGHIEYAF